jgi:hypothetical protein
VNINRSIHAVSRLRYKRQFEKAKSPTTTKTTTTTTPTTHTHTGGGGGVVIGVVIGTYPVILSYALPR